MKRIWRRCVAILLVLSMGIQPVYAAGGDSRFGEFSDGGGLGGGGGGGSWFGGFSDGAGGGGGGGSWFGADDELNYDSLLDQKLDAIKNGVSDKVSDKIASSSVSTMRKTAEQAIADMKEASQVSEILGNKESGTTAMAKLGEKATTFLEVIDSVTTSVSLISDGFKVMNLKNDHVLTELAEVATITMDVALVMMGVFGVIGFPWSVIIAALVGVLLNILRSEKFGDWVDEHFGEQMDAIDEWLRKLLGQNRTPNGVNALKPNIYLYSKTPREIQVVFDEPALLTQSIPDYSGGWKVTADADGNLVGEDGQPYGYLFYESRTYKGLFQTEEGYRIPAEYREAAFTEILSAMNFTEREIADFTEFWVEKLPAGQDYIMYPQYTETVDLAMPVTIREKPEHTERIWFVFEKDRGQDVDPPAPYRLNRSFDYYAVEWGGLIFD